MRVCRAHFAGALTQMAQAIPPLIPHLLLAPDQDPEASANALTRNAPQPSFPVKSRTREPPRARPKPARTARTIGVKQESDVRSRDRLDRPHPDRKSLSRRIERHGRADACRACDPQRGG